MHDTADLTALDTAATRDPVATANGAVVWRRWGQGPAVVLLHGGSGSWTHWIRTISPVVDAGYEVWAPDLPGLGDSAMPPPPLTPATCGRVLAEGWRQLAGSERTVHLVGFSFGGHVGTMMAAELGGTVASLTLSGCAALGLPHPYFEFVREHARMSEAERRSMHAANLARLMIADPAGIDALAIDIQAENMRRSRFRSRAFAKTDEIATTLSRVLAPLNAIWGEKDPIALPSVAARFDVLRRHHPELEARIIARAGHWAAYEQPAAFNAALLELLAVRGGRAIPSFRGGT